MIFAMQGGRRQDDVGEDYSEVNKSIVTNENYNTFATTHRQGMIDL